MSIFKVLPTVLTVTAVSAALGATGSACERLRPPCPKPLVAKADDRSARPAPTSRPPTSVTAEPPRDPRDPGPIAPDR